MRDLMINNSEAEITDEQKLDKTLLKIGRVLLILSGKGGVGKSTVAVNISAGLAASGKKTGLLDLDIHGPSIPGMLGLEESRLMSDENGMLPVEFMPDFKVISIGFMLESKKDAVIWRGPMKYGVIKQFLSDVNWGDLDYLVVDLPPGTGDEPLTIAQLTAGKAEAIIVTTPQKVSVDDVRRSVGFCKSLNLPVLGIVENMSGFICPKCGEKLNIFGSDGGKELSNETGAELLGEIPFDISVMTSCDDGTPLSLSQNERKNSEFMLKIIEKITKTEKQS
jgi:ATP-binding protein involved in chromosome partitioning